MNLATLKKKAEARRHSVYTKDAMTTTVTWRFAMMIAQERAFLRNTKQSIKYDPANFNWKVQDKA